MRTRTPHRHRSLLLLHRTQAERRARRSERIASNTPNGHPPVRSPLRFKRAITKLAIAIVRRSTKLSLHTSARRPIQTSRTLQHHDTAAQGHGSCSRTTTSPGTFDKMVLSPLCGTNPQSTAQQFFNSDTATSSLQIQADGLTKCSSDGLAHPRSSFTSSSSSSSSVKLLLYPLVVRLIGRRAPSEWSTSVEGASINGLSATCCFSAALVVYLVFLQGVSVSTQKFVAFRHPGCCSRLGVAVYLSCTSTWHFAAHFG